MIAARLTKKAGNAKKAKYSGLHWFINRRVDGGLELPLKVVQAPNCDRVSTGDLPESKSGEVWQLLEAGQYEEDLELELFGRRGGYLRQRFYRKVEANFQLLESLEGETAKSELAGQVRQVRLELAKSQTSLAELAESQAGLADCARP
jgi:hypothetical protein